MGKIKRIISNPCEMVYKLFFKMRMSVPRWIGQQLKKNYMLSAQELYSQKMIGFDSYDGSGQLTHPSFCIHNHKGYLAATPFPYSMSTYENPCIYRNTGQNSFKMIAGPIEKPQRSGDDYLNDPCLISDDCLRLYYRHTFVQNGKEFKNLLMSSESIDGILWSPPQVQIEEKGDTLVSPAIIKFKGDYYLFYVKLERNIYKISFRESDSGQKWNKEKQCSIADLPSEYQIWHLDVDVFDNKIVSLFTTRTNSGRYKLFFAYLRMEDMTWICEREIEITDIDMSKIKIIYKSTFVNKTNILVAVRDFKNRWAIIKQDINWERIDEETV